MRQLIRTRTLTAYQSQICIVECCNFIQSKPFMFFDSTRKCVVIYRSSWQLPLSLWCGHPLCTKRWLTIWVVLCCFLVIQFQWESERAMISFSSVRRGGFVSREVIAEGINKRIPESTSVLVQRAAHRGKHTRADHSALNSCAQLWRCRGLGRWICNPQVPGSNLPPYQRIDLCLLDPDSTPPHFINSQLVSVQSVGIFNKLLLYFQLIYKWLFMSNKISPF